MSLRSFWTGWWAAVWPDFWRVYLTAMRLQGSRNVLLGLKSVWPRPSNLNHFGSNRTFELWTEPRSRSLRWKDRDSELESLPRSWLSGGPQPPTGGVDCLGWLQNRRDGFWWLNSSESRNTDSATPLSFCRTRFQSVTECASWPWKAASRTKNPQNWWRKDGYFRGTVKVGWAGPFCPACGIDAQMNSKEVCRKLLLYWDSVCVQVSSAGRSIWKKQNPKPHHRPVSNRWIPVFIVFSLVFRCVLVKNCHVCLVLIALFWKKFCCTGGVFSFAVTDSSSERIQDRNEVGSVRSQKSDICVHRNCCGYARPAIKTSPRRQWWQKWLLETCWFERSSPSRTLRENWWSVAASFRFVIVDVLFSQNFLVTVGLLRQAERKIWMSFWCHLNSAHSGLLWRATGVSNRNNACRGQAINSGVGSVLGSNVQFIEYTAMCFSILLYILK